MLHICNYLHAEAGMRYESCGGWATLIRLRWPEPVEGGAIEVYRLSDDRRSLTQTTTIHVKSGRRCCTRSAPQLP